MEAPITSRPKTSIFLIAAEESGDRLGAALMRALKEARGEAVTFSGIGGRDMAEQGLRSLFPTEELSIVGLAAIPRRLPLILRRIEEAARAVVAAKPDVLVIIDSPDFTHRVARRVRRRDPTIPIVNYVSPSVWAWRPGRARAMRRYVDHVLALLPFEPAAHARLGGPPCTYVGHPLIEQLQELRPNADEQRRRQSAPPIVLMLPGSRRSEIDRLLQIFQLTLDRVREDHGAIEVVILTIPELVAPIERGIAGWTHRPRIVTEQRAKRAAFRQARAALAKSGTVTLELALAGVPMVAAYRVSAFEAIVARRVIRVPSVILANLVLGESVVPEYLQEDCTPDKLSRALLPLLAESEERRRQIEAFARLDQIMAVGQAAPARRAADIVLQAADKIMRKGKY